jgi:hypothetical protein
MLKHCMRRSGERPHQRKQRGRRSCPVHLKIGVPNEWGKMSSM